MKEIAIHLYAIATLPLTDWRLIEVVFIPSLRTPLEPFAAEGKSKLKLKFEK